MKKVVISLFDGISCGKVALERLGVKDFTYYASEIDKDAIVISEFNHKDIIRIGDVNKVSYKDGVLYTENGDFYVGKVDLLIGGSPCFVAGTKVQTNEGLKSIEDIKIGDIVLTHTNTYKEVLNIGGSIGKETYVVKAQGMIPTTTTYNHPYYVRSKSKDVLSSPTWKQAVEMVKGDYIGFPINRISENPLNLTEDECLVIGRYIADGHTRKDFRKEEGREEHRHWQLILSIGEDKVVGFSNKYKLPHSMYKHTQSTNRAVFSSKRLVKIVEEHCGTRSDSKVFSQMLLNLPTHLLSRVFEGYSDGDGCNTKQGWQATTVSKDLALSLSQAIVKITGRGCNVTFCTRPKTRIIEGRTVNQKDTYLVRINSSDKHAWIKDDDIIWYPIKNVTKTGINETVYNIEVAEDNSYTANNFIVHNCQSFSRAAAYSGNQNGLDGKSKLFFEYLRILNEIKQDNSDVEFLLENVKMKKDSKKELDEYLGVDGVYCNSELVSFQRRSRFYWTNWGWELPQDKKISFQDYKGIGVEKACIPNKTPSRERMWREGAGNNSQGSCANITHANKVYCLTTKQDRCPNSGMIEYEDFARYLSQNEMELAQTLDVGYTFCVSYNKAAKALGNGWTVDVIKHILSSSNFVKNSIKNSNSVDSNPCCV